MASERQLQDRGNSTQEDSLGIQDAQQVSDQAIISNSPTDSDPTEDLEQSQQLDLLTNKLQDSLKAIDADAAVS